ncbi:MAG: 2-hydroxy-acid oxidase [Jatrophihabitantaceae bacterium]
MFVTSSQPVPSAGSTGGGLRLVRAERQGFAGPAEFLHSPDDRAHLGNYLADLTRPYGLTVPGELFDSPSDLGQSYGEMAEALIRATVPVDEPVDLLVLAFAVHDMQPGRATATYLSHVCPGTPLSFAICEQGSAAAFSGLRVARDYAASAGCRRTLLIVAEQASVPYPTHAPVPARHRGVALLFDAESPDGPSGPRLVGLRQQGGVPAGEVAARAAACLAELTAGDGRSRLVVSEALAWAWPAAGARVAPAGQPSTGLWWQLIDELADGPDLVVAADYDPDLGYLCLAALSRAGAATPGWPVRRRSRRRRHTADRSPRPSRR